MSFCFAGQSVSSPNEPSLAQQNVAHQRLLQMAAWNCEQVHEMMQVLLWPMLLIHLHHYPCLCNQKRSCSSHSQSSQGWVPQKMCDYLYPGYQGCLCQPHGIHTCGQQSSAVVDILQNCDMNKATVAEFEFSTKSQKIMNERKPSKGNKTSWHTGAQDDDDNP